MTYDYRCLKTSIPKDFRYQKYQHSVCHSSNHYNQLSLEQAFERCGNGGIETLECTRCIIYTYQPKDKADERHDTHSNRCGCEKSQQ